MCVVCGNEECAVPSKEILEWNAKCKSDRRDYYRDYQRKRRSEYLHSSGAIDYSEGIVKTALNRATAAYDPLRDGLLRHENAQAAFFGDPPIGRRAIDDKVRCTARTKIITHDIEALS